MPMSPSPKPVCAYAFGEFRLNAQDRILERNGARVLLTPKVIDILFVLVQNAGQLVTKESLMKAVWPDVTVVESGLTRNISVLRKALEEDAPEGSYIETIPRRGYRFVANVTPQYYEPEPSPQPEIETLPSPVAIENVTTSVEPKTHFLRWLTLAGSILLGALAWFILRPAPPNTDPPVGPSVRIGEHHLYKLAPEQAVRALEQFEQALSTTPNSAAAHAGLSIALMQMPMLGLRALAEIADRAEVEANRALELDPNLSSAQYAAGLVSLFHHWHFDKAEQHFTRALKLDPSSVQARLGYTQLKFAKGEVNEAIRLTEEALRLDPASPLLGARYCQAFYYARDFHRAEAECRKVLDREPRFALAEYYLALSLGWVGRTDQARQTFDQTAMAAGVIEADRAWLSLRDGDRRPAKQVLESRRELIRQGKVNASAKLMLSTILGYNDEAFEALQAAIDTRAVELLTLRIDPRLDGIRSDPRYPPVLQRIGLSPLGQ